jgi:hypothetical protein
MEQNRIYFSSLFEFDIGGEYVCAKENLSRAYVNAFHSDELRNQPRKKPNGIF